MRIYEQTATPTKPAPPADPLLIDARALAKLLTISIATLNRWKAAGLLPRHIELSGGCHRWRLEEIRDWINAGCPPVKEWEARRR